jgi:SAM-dependent MidA family methyltransferase
MTALARRIAERIAALGPMPVSEFMATCLFDPDHGYYTTREPFGVEGDFVTAPEVSQMFGELVAVWVYSAWQAIGRPMPVCLAEIGPGRGTLMADMLRTLDRLDTGFAAGLDVAMVEASPRLAETQRGTLDGARVKPTWHASIDALPAMPAIIVANELFDALPIRQFVRTGRGWLERMVTVDDEGDLAFAAGGSGIDPSLLPPGANDQPEGAIFEAAPARQAMMDTIAGRIAASGGAALVFDYGHLEPGFGDTLQAVRRHAFDPVLAHPGEADLTSHVDFAALAVAASAHGLATRAMTQGQFLIGMGLLQRAGVLGAGAGEADRDRIRGEAERLAGDDGMGRLFKALMVSMPGIDLPPSPAD